MKTARRAPMVHTRHSSRCNSIGRVSVSKADGCRFESCHRCVALALFIWWIISTTIILAVDVTRAEVSDPA